MSLSVEALWAMSDIDLLGAYYKSQRDYVERKFARDTQRGRLEWLRAKAFAASLGGVSERRNTVELSEELARKGQEVREMTRDLDLCESRRRSRRHDRAAQGSAGAGAPRCWNSGRRSATKRFKTPA